jgi:hypothetical protein
MSALLESLSGAERRAECERYDAILESAIGRMLGHQNRAAQSAYETALERGELAAKAEADLREALLALVAGGKIDAVATFEAPRNDWKNRRADGSYPVRPATLFDVLLDTSSYRDFDRRLLALFVRAANGAHVAADAQELMQDIAQLYASQNAEVD